MAVKTQQQLTDEIALNLASASSITAAEHRQVAQDIVDTMFGNIVSVPSWLKVTKAYTDFATAATENDIEIYLLSDKHVLHEVVLKHSIGFTGGAISMYTLSVGQPLGLDQFLAPFDVFQAAAGSKYEQSTVDSDLRMVFGTTRSIRCNAISTDANLNAATAGTVDIWLLLSTLP